LRGRRRFEERSYRLILLGNDPQCPIDGLVAERNIAAHPEPLFLRRRNLVADALCCDLAFELGKRQQYVQGQASHTGGCVEGLGHRDERRPCSVETLGQLCEVRERSCEPVDLVDDDAIHPTRLHVLHQALQRRTIEMPARDAAIIVAFPDRHPAFMALAGNVGLASFMLRIERVEVLLEPLLARLPCVDGASGLRHAERFPARPKNLGPDQAVPVIRFATAESER